MIKISAAALVACALCAWTASAVVIGIDFGVDTFKVALGEAGRPVLHRHEHREQAQDPVGSMGECLCVCGSNAACTPPTWAGAHL
jgi:hypothetical protein